jgi:hypothetical protein
MIDTSRENNQIILRQLDPHPFVLLATHVKVSLAITDVADLLVFVQMLVEEHLHLVLVRIAHRLWRDDYLIAVLVPALLGQFVDGLEGREVVVLHSDGGEVVYCYWTAGVMGFSLVALL